MGLQASVRKVHIGAFRVLKLQVRFRPVVDTKKLATDDGVHEEGGRCTQRDGGSCETGRMHRGQCSSKVFLLRSCFPSLRSGRRTTTLYRLGLVPGPF
jgi:hypothetical protein